MPAIVGAALLYLAPTTAAAIGITSSVYLYAAIEAVTLAASYLSYQSAKSKGSKYSDNGFLANTQSPEEVLPVLYGRHRIGGNVVYINSTGENNKYLHLILTLSEGPIEGIETIYLDDKPISDYGGLVYYEFFNGAGDQGLCTTLQNHDANWADYMRWTAYLYLRLEYDSEKFTGVPSITVVAKGRHTYDPRSGLTAYSNNTALVVRDFLTSRRYGLGLDSSQIDDDFIIDAANWYESQANPYTFNGVIADRQAFLDNIGDILLNGRADIIWSAGKYKLLVRKYDTPVMSFDEDEIVEDSFTIAVPGLADTPNRVVVTYPDEANVSDTDDLGWTSTEKTIEDSNAVLLYDNEERDLEMSLIGTTNETQATLLATYNLERAGLNKTFSFTVHPRALALEPGDMIQVTHTLPGWTDRPVRVVDINISQDGLVGLTVIEEDVALYDDTLNLSPHTYFKTNLPNSLAPVPEATSVVFAEEEYYNKDTSYTRLKVSFNEPNSPFWDYSEVWVNIGGEGYNHYTDTTGTFTIEPVEEGAAYKIKLISVSIQGVRSDFSTATEWAYTVVGKNTPPPDVQNFRAIPQSDTIVLMWDAVSAVDLQGYEIRRGANWGGGIFIGFTRAVTFQLNGQPPGTHTFMIKSVDTNGKYSTNYALATTTVYGPASYTEKMSQYNDFLSGTFDNTERYNDPTYGVMLRVARGNSITNNDFESDTTGWSLGASWARSNVRAYSGSYSIASPGSGSGAGTSTYKQDSEIVSEIGKTYSFASYAWSDTPNQARLSLAVDGELISPAQADGTFKADGSITAGGKELVVYSGYHPGDSTWAKLEVTREVQNGLLSPKAGFRKEIASGQAYFDSCRFSNAGLTGKYISPTYDRGSVVTRRCWPQFDILYLGTGAAWWDQFTAISLWTDKFGASDTWLWLFGAYIAGVLKMRLGYSTDNINFTWVDYFENYVAEVQARYVQYEIQIQDAAVDGYLCCKPVYYREAYWY